MVAVARSAPVGRPPLVARTLSVKFGVVPVQPEQKRLMSTFVSKPVTDGVNVCPAHVVVVMPTPLLPRVVFCWSRLGFASTTSPGLALRSTLLGTPAWKSVCDVSVRQAPLGAVDSAKFWVVALPSVTAILVAEAGLQPGKVAVMLG